MSEEDMRKWFEDYLAKEAEDYERIAQLHIDSAKKLPWWAFKRKYLHIGAAETLQTLARANRKALKNS